MAARWRTQLMCSALLGALAISCGAPPISGQAPPAPRDAQQQTGGQQGEVEQQPPAEEQSPPAEQQSPPAEQQRGPASQGSDGSVQAPDSERPPKQSTGGQWRPSGNAPGVGHSIPAVNQSDYQDRDSWEKSQHKECIKALGPGNDNCVTLRYQWFKEDESGDLNTAQPIRDPTPNYRNYESCTVRYINPPSDHPVPPHTVITIKIGCYAPETEPSDQPQPGSNQDEENTQYGKSTSDQDQVTTKDRHNKERQSGG